LNLEANNFGIQIRENLFIILKHSIKLEIYATVSVLGKNRKFIDGKKTNGINLYLDQLPFEEREIL
jgi:hypothetical protein